MQTLAQMAADAPGALLAYGPMGVIMLWFMSRFEVLIKEVRNYGHKIDGLRLALLAQAAASETANPNVRRLAEEEMARIRAKDGGK